MKKLIIPSSVRAVKSKMHSLYLEEIIFDNSPIKQLQTRQFFDSKNLKRVDFGNACNILNLPAGFFYGCENLVSVSLPQSLMRLADSWQIEWGTAGVFEGCTSLKSIELPSTIYYIGADAFSGCTSLETIEIAWQKSVSVGSDAFKDCVSLKAFQPVGGVSSVGERAFENCPALTSANIYSDKELEIGAYTFSGCSSLIDLKYNPSKLKSIGRSAFHNCSSLTSFSLSANTEFIAENDLGQQYAPGNPFDGCTAIEKFEVTGNNGPTRSEDGVLMCDDMLIAYPAGKKDRTYTIPDGIARLTDAAFGGAKNLETVSGGADVSQMGTMVFSGCSSLRQVGLPAQLEALPGGTFAGCSSLEAVDLPDGITVVGLRAFDGCKALSAIELPATVDSIAESAFAGCASIATLTIPEGVTELLPATFRGCGSLTRISLPEKLKSIQFSALEGCTSLESVEIPASVTEIGDRSFKDCDALAAVTIPDAVSELGMGAFEDCDALRSVSVGEGVKEIGRFAFYDCEALETVRLGSAVTAIGDAAFEGDYNIREITCLSPEPPAYPTGFPEEVIQNATVSVPAGCEDAYNAETTWAPMVDGDDTALFNPVEAIQLDATTLTLEIGGAYKLVADVFPLDADDASLIWSSSDDGVATVTATGIVTAVSTGNAVITTRAADGSGVTATCSVNVVTYNPNAGLDAILADGGLWDVYNVTGTLIGRDCTPEAISALAPGLYILRQGSLALKVALP
ncbi:MAG: leucine-rich repeat protein [Muribaculaceae bacterium]|nr:leucine-rich repeat protein [Muribaculaceae bacterium]